ncbi:MAG TPA: hypothetical protein VGL69_25385 [Solirubrobacteraceae bacterium]|jgi:hypothetical protein
MKKFLIAGAAALAALALCATAAWAVTLPTFKSDLIVPNRSLAGVTLKSTYKEAIRAFSSGTRGCSTTKGCSYQAANGASFSILFAKLTETSKPIVAEISIQAGRKVSGVHDTPVFDTPLAAMKTAQGIGLGSTLGALKRAYPHLTGNAVDGFEIKGHGEYGTHFGLLGGRVTLIQMQAVHLG